MSVDHGGSTEEQRAEAPRDSGRHVFAHLYESYAASLFDYCDGLLLDMLAAVDAVQDSLGAADAQVDSAPGPDGLRLALYSAARQECLSQLGGRTKLSGRAETTTLDDLGAAVPDYEVAGPTGETVLILRAALDRLSGRDRERLNLTFRSPVNEGDVAPGRRAPCPVPHQPRPPPRILRRLRAQPRGPGVQLRADQRDTARDPARQAPAPDQPDRACCPLR